MDEKKFDNFLYTLDPKSLGNQPEHIQKELLDFADKKNNRNKPWYHILYNHFSEYSKNEILKLTRLADENRLYISGPMSLTKHESKKYKKTIYIFGEKHGRENTCGDEYLTIYEFFIKYMVNIDKFIDIYIEAPYIKTESGADIDFKAENYDTYLSSDIANSKYLSELPNLRIHRTDLREYLNITRDVLNDIVYGFIKPIQKKLEEFLEKYKDITFHEMLFSKSLEKQFKKIVSEELLKKIMQFITNEVQELHCDINYFDLIKFGIQMKIDNEYIPFKEIFKSDLFEDFYSEEYTALIIDIYLIARLFKIFDVKPGDFHPTEAKNIFIYTGDAHAEIYRCFLGLIGFSGKNIAMQIDEKCIRVFKPIVF